MKRFLCKLGFHAPGSVTGDYVRSTGNYRGLSEWVLQQGVRACTRDGCRFTEKVWRQGWLNTQSLHPFGNMSRWRTLDAKKEAYVLSLQYRELMG